MNDTPLQIALQHHQAGRLAQAETIYRQILAQEPLHADALHLLGVLRSQSGNAAQAVDLIRQAIARRPDAAEFYNNLGGILRGLGRLDEALAAYRDAVRLKPAYATAQYNLGLVLCDAGKFPDAQAALQQAAQLMPQSPEVFNCLGKVLRHQHRLDEAIAALRKALELKPQSPAVHNNLGNALRDAGQLDDAAAAYARAIELQNDFAEAHLNQGNLLRQRKQFRRSIAALERAIGLKPDWPDAHTSLALALQEVGRLDAALDAAQRAINLGPDSAEAHNNLGGVLFDLLRFDQAIAAYARAIELNPAAAHIYGNLAIALRSKGRFDQAIAAHRQALVLQENTPELHMNLGITLGQCGQLDAAENSLRHAIQLKSDLHEAHWALALLLLLRGDYPAGWREYDSWWTMHPPKFSQPRWHGDDLGGKRILLHVLEGLGDAMQFVRYAPLLAQRHGRVILLAQPELQKLLSPMPGIEQVVRPGQSLPPFDVHCPLLALPQILGTTLDSIPGPIPYLRPDAALTQAWDARLGKISGSRRIGLVWAGNPKHSNDANRSLPLHLLSDLAAVPGVEFYSLQKGFAAAQIHDVPQLRLIDHTADLHDFADTAALIAQLDLVIAVDTAIVHLAGAMGKPVWAMLPFSPEWRWMLRREDSPWYPTMRLFRQATFGDWPGVIRHVAQELAAFAGAGGGPPGSPCK